MSVRAGQPDTECLAYGFIRKIPGLSGGSITTDLKR